MLAVMRRVPEANSRQLASSTYSKSVRMGRRLSTVAFSACARPFMARPRP